MQGSKREVCSEGASGKSERRKDIKNNSCLFEYPPLWQLLCSLLYIDFLTFSSHWGNCIQLQITDEETEGQES